MGQEQEYFLYRLHVDIPELSLDHREFCAYRWIALPSSRKKCGFECWSMGTPGKKRG